MHPDYFRYIHFRSFEILPHKSLPSARKPRNTAIFKLSLIPEFSVKCTLGLKRKVMVLILILTRPIIHARVFTCYKKSQPICGNSKLTLSKYSLRFMDIFFYGVKIQPKLFWCCSVALDQYSYFILIMSVLILDNHKALWHHLTPSLNDNASYGNIFFTPPQVTGNISFCL